MNIFEHTFSTNKRQKELQKSQKACTIWMTGLSASGKSTIANQLDKVLTDQNYHTFILDGDNTRLGLNKNLGFSIEDREENIRRVSEVCKLFNNAGIIVICSFISPQEKNRLDARQIIGEDFIEVWINANLDTCESRDPKGLYKKARAGEIKDFTGISADFDIPMNAINLENNNIEDIEKNVDFLIQYLKNKNYIK